MESKNLLAKVRVLLPATLAFFSMNAFSATPDITPDSRPEVSYRQQHSFTLGEQTGLFADGIRLRLDLSVLEETEAERTIDTSVIPSNDIYGGIWSNRFVDVYGRSLNIPESFKVDLSHFTMPTEGHMTSNFGRRGRRYHYGVDLKVQTGDTIYAAFDGKIRVAQFQRGGYGFYIVIRHTNGLETVYGHLSKFLVEENEFVMSGQPIGLGGSTGRSTGSHLHFETRFLGRPINPNFIIDFENQVAHRDEYLVTNSSFQLTTNSSSVRRPAVENRNVQTASTNSANAFVSGDVQHHRIRSGDTLGAIARRYGTTVQRLCALNNITPTTTLRVGRSLRVS
jgi:murein DD-endopeptidase MepM/ murein hydrolase activator NlpD